MDYIFGRTDDPHGATYKNHVNVGLNNPEMECFVEMCFDPGSPMNERLKKTLVQMLSETDISLCQWLFFSKYLENEAVL